MKSEALNMDRFKVVPSDRSTERGDLLDQFLERLNPSRIAAGYPKLTHGRLAFMVAHLTTDDLHAFYKDCTTAQCGFSKCFWGRLKVR